jgi:hypothetical protein
MKKLNTKAFSIPHLLIILIVIGLLAAIGWYVWKNNQKTITNFEECKAAGNPIMESYPEQCSANGQTFTNTTQKVDKPAETKKTETKYLEIKELNVKVPLTSDTADAYYVINRGYAYLSVHALDGTDCKVSDETYDDDTGTLKYSGVAALASFKAGDSDEVAGDYQKAYPKAPLIDGKYYYIGRNQYDCTDGKKSDLYTKAAKAFVEAYPKIQKLE